MFIISSKFFLSLYNEKKKQFKNDEDIMKIEISNHDLSIQQVASYLKFNYNRGWHIQDYNLDDLEIAAEYFQNSQLLQLIQTHRQKQQQQQHQSIKP
jgi:hypothetical protein